MLLPEKDRDLTHQQISALDKNLLQLEAVESKLAGELDHLRAQIADIRGQRAVLKSRIAAVWCLPNEILSYIFQLGVSEQRAAEEASAEEEIEDLDEIFKIKVDFQVLVSQVCRMFRQVAICTPSLWTRIYTFHLAPSQLDFLQTYLDRSGTSQLDILLDTEDLCPDNTGDKKKLQSFTKILVPHASRFQRFVVRLRGFTFLHTVMCMLDQPAPRLEALELTDIDFEAAFDENDPFGRPELMEPLTLFGGVVPNLCKLKLDGVHIDWNTCNFKNLVQLALGYHTRDVRPTYEEFRALIQASPTLQALELTGSAPLIPEDATDSPQYIPMAMEHLVSLTISDIPSDYVTTLVSLLQAPNLTFLALTDLDSNDYSGLLNKIAGPPVMFPALTSLKLATIEVTSEAYEGLLRAYSTLTYLSLHFARWSLTSQAFIQALAPRQEPDEVMCPKLECLRCVGAYVCDIKRVLECRLDAGFEIPRLELDQETAERGHADGVLAAAEPCMEWLRNNAEVQIIIPSPHGSDDEYNGTMSDSETDGDDVSEGLPYFTVDDFYSDVDWMDEDDEDDDEEYENDSDVMFPGGIDGAEDTGTETTNSTDESNHD